jgi:uncharacterized protein YeaO (DUF488 family)
MKKEAVAADAWMKEVAPSTELRKWFGHHVERWDKFRRRYRKELNANPSAWEPILDASGHGMVTLLYSAHDVFHNGAVVLRDYLTERQTRQSRLGKRGRQRVTSKTIPSTKKSAVTASNTAGVKRKRP